MASWPTIDNIKAVYTKLNDSDLDGKLTWALGKSETEIITALANRYDVTLWGVASSVVPPDLVQLAYDMTYAWTNLATHMGAKLAASDQLAEDLLQKSRLTLLGYAMGSSVLLDDNRLEVGEKSLANGVPLLATPVFGMRPPLTWGITLYGQRVPRREF